MDIIEEFQEQQIISHSVLRNISNDNQSHISLIDIIPLPKAIHIQTRRKNPSKPEIITDSRFKTKLEEKQKQIDQKSNKIGIPKMDMKSKSNPKKKYNIKKDKATDKSSKQEYYCPVMSRKVRRYC
ncbi:unnamed protein product [Acanthoscelides obtectus]|uniref:Uncharacterized protein n=1 Tax=Acanthoscelides obtectus TaxID=200917 RepID=A0A9P0L1T0_ACAOB|nr:unnamed protein product [Acanthoscelides obtectus]CAK1681630.1 hypothetical protein AOBTE_LOCUS33176 [Acanthoscelides obtectus]